MGGKLTQLYIAYLSLVAPLLGFLSLPPTFASEDKTWMMNKVTVVHDVTSLIHADSQLGGESNALADVYLHSVNGSIFYYQTNVDTYDGSCHRDDTHYSPSDGQYRHYSCDSRYALEGISVMFNSKVNSRNLLQISEYLKPFATESITLLMKNYSSILETVVISFAYNSSDCDCSSSIDKMTEYFEMLLQNIMVESSGKQSFEKLGLEVNQNFLQCCHDKNFGLLGKVNRIILRIELTPLSTMLSCGLFSEMMEKVVDKYRTYMQKQSPNSTLYIRLVIRNWKNVITKANYSRYESLVTKFVYAWILEESKGNQVVFIAPPHNKTATISGNDQFLRQRLMPRIDASKNLNLGHQTHEIIKNLRSVFNTVLLKNPSVDILKNAVSSENSSTSILFKNGQNMNRTETIKMLNYLLNESSALNIGAVNLDNIRLRDAHVKPLVRRLHSKNIKIGCHMRARYYDNLQGDFQKEVADNIKSCCLRVPLSSQVLFQFVLHIPTRADLIGFLSELQKANIVFGDECSGKNLIPSIRIESIGTGSTFINLKSDTPSHSFYCNANLKLVNEYYQTILSFANIHWWKQLVLQPLSDHPDDFGFWRNVETSKEINRNLTDFPVLVRSNSEKRLDGDLPMTYDCIEWTRPAEQSGINFLANQYSGTTIQANIRREPPLKVRELQTALLFALTRFSFIELIGVNLQMMAQVSAVLTEEVLDSVKRFRGLTEITSPLVYIEVPAQNVESVQQTIWQSTAQNITSVHISGWESLSEHKLNTVFEEISSMNIEFPLKYGITVQNCSHEMNLGLWRLKSLPFTKTASYLVCNAKPVSLTNVDLTWMEKYFGTLFYTKVYMERVLSTESRRMEVMFRINLVSTDGVCTEKNSTNLFLSFLNDMNQHSAKYNIRYFIVGAFEKEDANQACRNSWWQIKDYSDLTNVSVYMDAEYDYFGLPTKLEVPLPQTDIPSVRDEGQLPRNFSKLTSATIVYEDTEYEHSSVADETSRPNDYLDLVNASVYVDTTDDAATATDIPSRLGDYEHLANISVYSASDTKNEQFEHSANLEVPSHTADFANVTEKGSSFNNFSNGRNVSTYENTESGTGKEALHNLGIPLLFFILCSLV